MNAARARHAFVTKKIHRLLPDTAREDEYGECAKRCKRGGGKNKRTMPSTRESCCSGEEKYEPITLCHALLRRLLARSSIVCERYLGVRGLPTLADEPGPVMCAANEDAGAVQARLKKMLLPAYLDSSTGDWRPGEVAAMMEDIDAHFCRDGTVPDALLRERRDMRAVLVRLLEEPGVYISPFTYHPHRHRGRLPYYRAFVRKPMYLARVLAAVEEEPVPSSATPLHVRVARDVRLVFANFQRYTENVNRSCHDLRSVAGRLYAIFVDTYRELGYDISSSGVPPRLAPETEVRHQLPVREIEVAWKLKRQWLAELYRNHVSVLQDGIQTQRKALLRVHRPAGGSADAKRSTDVANKRQRNMHRALLSVQTGVSDKG